MQLRGEGSRITIAALYKHPSYACFILRSTLKIQMTKSMLSPDKQLIWREAREGKVLLLCSTYSNFKKRNKNGVIQPKEASRRPRPSPSEWQTLTDAEREQLQRGTSDELFCCKIVTWRFHVVSEGEGKG